MSIELYIVSIIQLEAQRQLLQFLRLYQDKRAQLILWDKVLWVWVIIVDGYEMGRHREREKKAKKANNKVLIEFYYVVSREREWSRWKAWNNEIKKQQQHERASSEKSGK